MDYHNHPKVMAWLYRLCFFTNNNKNNSNNNDDDNDNYNNNPHAQSLLSHELMHVNEKMADQSFESSRKQTLRNQEIELQHAHTFSTKQN